jgi:enoyl-CoA hydratase/carnithine racemase
MSGQLVNRYAHEGWLEIALNRPERRNAVIGPLVYQLIDAIDVADLDENVGVILIRGEGNAFCSGLDLKVFNSEPQPDWMPGFGATWRRMHERILAARTAIIGALELCAINGGAALALACDLLVVGDQSFLQVGEVQGGMPAPMNVAWLRLRYPETVAMQLALTGRRFIGPELVRLGVALQSVPDDQVLSEARELATRLAGYPEGALSRIKGAIRSYATQDPRQWFDRASASDPLRGFRPSRTKA